MVSCVHVCFVAPFFSDANTKCLWCNYGHCHCALCVCVFPLIVIFLCCILNHLVPQVQSITYWKSLHRLSIAPSRRYVQDSSKIFNMSLPVVITEPNPDLLSTSTFRTWAFFASNGGSVGKCMQVGWALCGCVGHVFSPWWTNMAGKSTFSLGLYNIMYTLYSDRSSL